MRVAGYEFAPGARFQSGAVGTAGEVGGHLELLRQQTKGELQPIDVVNDARNSNSPLHSYFEWDDGKAAEEHRLAQARTLIRAVVAVYVDDKKPATRQKAFVHIAAGKESHYRATHHAMSQKETREKVLQQAWREFAAWRDRYRHLKEFSKLFEVAEEVASKLPKAG